MVNGDKQLIRWYEYAHGWLMKWMKLMKRGSETTPGAPATYAGDIGNATRIAMGLGEGDLDRAKARHVHPRGASS